MPDFARLVISYDPISRLDALSLSTKNRSQHIYITISSSGGVFCARSKSHWNQRRQTVYVWCCVCCDDSGRQALRRRRRWMVAVCVTQLELLKFESHRSVIKLKIRAAFLTHTHTHTHQSRSVGRRINGRHARAPSNRLPPCLSSQRRKRNTYAFKRFVRRFVFCLFRLRAWLAPGAGWRCRCEESGWKGLV